MDTTFFKSLVVGILITLALYLALSKAFDINSAYIRKSLGLFAGWVGLLSTFWFLENPNFLEKYVAEIAVAGIGVVLALFALAKKSLK